MEVRSPGYRIRSFMGEEEEEEGIGNDVSPKVTDQPEFCCGFPVFQQQKNSARRKEMIILRIRVSSSFSKSTRFSSINAEQPFGRSSFQN